MTDLEAAPARHLAPVTEQSLRTFVADISAHLTPPTIERYAAVIDALLDFLDVVDVEPRLGSEVARHLGDARARSGTGAFLPTLGVVSLLRVLPDFLADPWLPPAGARRRTHRVVVEKLLTFLRRSDLVDTAALRSDLKNVRSALGAAHSLDYQHDWGRAKAEPDRGELVTVTVTVSVASSVLDGLLDRVERGAYDSLDEAIETSLDPETHSSGYPYYW